MQDHQSQHLILLSKKINKSAQVNAHQSTTRFVSAFHDNSKIYLKSKLALW